MRNQIRNSSQRYQDRCLCCKRKLWVIIELPNSRRFAYNSNYTSSSSTEIDDIIYEFDDRFHGIVQKSVQAEIHIDKNITPLTQPHRRIPFHMRKKVEKELERLEQEDIIETIEGPTPWVSPIVVAPKPKMKLGYVLTCVFLIRLSKENDT